MQSAWGGFSTHLFQGPDKGNLEAPSVKPVGASFRCPSTWQCPLTWYREMIMDEETTRSSRVGKEEGKGLWGRGEDVLG